MPRSSRDYWWDLVPWVSFRNSSPRDLGRHRSRLGGSRKEKRDAGRAEGAGLDRSCTRVFILRERVARRVKSRLPICQAFNFRTCCLAVFFSTIPLTDIRTITLPQAASQTSLTASSPPHRSPTSASSLTLVYASSSSSSAWKRTSRFSGETPRRALVSA